MDVILSENAKRGAGAFNAGNKARTDALEIAVENGFNHIQLFENGLSRPRIALQIIHGIKKAIKCLDEGDIVMIQYPYHPDVVNSFLLQSLAFAKVKKRFVIMVLVHDIEALRGDCDEEGVNIRKEAKLLSHADYVVFHSDLMAEKMRASGFSENPVVLGPFDYLCDDGLKQKNMTNEKTAVVIAGNLSPEKSGYLYQLPHLHGLSFRLYGAGYKEPCRSVSSGSEILYMGKCAPEELVSRMEGMYGLIWDGESLSGCIGKTGQYLRYNSPHKFSSYIAAGLPVIVWGQSALASYVADMGIGIAVDSLNELEQILSHISEDEYLEMLSRTAELRKRIVAGGQLGASIAYVRSRIINAR